MDKKIIAVDFDGTLSRARWPGVGVPNFLLIHKLVELQKAGHKIIYGPAEKEKHYIMLSNGARK